MPAVFIDGKFFGGVKQLNNAAQDGSLVKKLQVLLVVCAPRYLCPKCVSAQSDFVAWCVCKRSSATRRDDNDVQLQRGTNMLLLPSP